jgi:cytochrome c-type biogenesis protein
MIGLFTGLSNMLQASLILAIVASMIWGVFSVLLSPCHLAGIPLIMGHIASKSDGTKKKAGFLALLFAFGMLVTLLIIGIITSILGRIIGDTGPTATYAVGAFLLFFGVYMTGVLPFDLFNFAAAPKLKKGGYFQSFLFGLIFGVALGPCTFAYMAPMLAIGFQSARTNPVFGVTLFGAFAIGHCVVIVAAGILTEVVQSFINWNNKSGASKIVKIVFGVLIAGAGAFLILRELIA